MSEFKYNFEVVNIVASAYTGVFIDLELLSQITPSISYDPILYHAAKVRYNDIGVTVSIVKSGSLLFSGGKTLENVENAKSRVIKEIQNVVNEAPSNPPLILNNIVVKLQWKHEINFEVISNFESRKLRITYEPERHPALFVHSTDSARSAMIYGNGITLLQGLKSFDSIDEFICVIEKIIYLS